MRLLHVTHQYRPAIGGAEKYIADLSEELARRGHQVDVFTSRSVDYRTWRAELPGFERLDGVSVYRFRSVPRGRLAWRALASGFRNYWRTESRRHEPFIFCGSGPLMPGMLMAILRRGREYDLVHINNLHYSHAYTAFIAGRACGLPVIISPHVHAEQRETHDVGYLHAILRGSHVVLCDTRAEKEYLQAREWNSEISVAGIGLRLDQYPPLERARSRAQFGLPADSFVILFLGRKADYKGLDLCLEAFSTLRRIRDNVHFLAVGPETEFSRRLWDRYSGMDGVVVRGAVSDEERLAALAACDVLAMPSVGEAFGIVYLEAWAYRKPVIGATIRSVSSVLSDGDDAFLVDPDRPAELVRCLAHLADDPEAAAHMGERGRAKLERRYTVERVGDVVEAACARAIRRHRTLR